MTSVIERRDVTEQEKPSAWFSPDLGGIGVAPLCNFLTQSVFLLHRACDGSCLHSKRGGSYFSRSFLESRVASLTVTVPSEHFVCGLLCLGGAPRRRGPDCPSGRFSRGRGLGRLAPPESDRRLNAGTRAVPPPRRCSPPAPRPRVSAARGAQLRSTGPDSAEGASPGLWLPISEGTQGPGLGWLHSKQANVTAFGKPAPGAARCSGRGDSRCRTADGQSAAGAPGSRVRPHSPNPDLHPEPRFPPVR